jgi:hypothetical protein
MIAPSARPALALALLLSACQRDDDVSGTLDTPSHIAVLDRGGAGPFREAVGYAADRHGGRIRVLALSENRYLTDDFTASFFRGAPLATGEARLLTRLAAYAPDADTATVLALDARFNQLLAVPHVDGREADGSPHEPVPRITSVELLDNDSSGADFTIDSLVVAPGYAATEVWTATSTGSVWKLEGTRSGTQPGYILPGAPFRTPRNSIAFVIRGTGTEGDQIRLTVDSGLTEVQLDGVPLELTLAPDASVGALTHQLGDLALLRWFEPATLELSAPLALGSDANPHRLAWSDDSATLFATDARAPVLYEVQVADNSVIAHPLPFTVQTLALVFSDTARLVYLARADAAEVWIFDLDLGTFIDVNLSTPEIDGMRFRSAVRGLALLPTAYEWPEAVDGVSRTGRTVAVSLHEGRVAWMEEGTGCLVRDGQGPRTELRSQTSQQADYSSINFSVAEPQTVFLTSVNDARRHVNVNPCAGIARDELWSLQFDRTVQAWRVEGDFSGEQAGLAYEDQRYVSDDGALSFLLRAGSLPSEDGWGLQFKVLDGVLATAGDNDADGVREINLDLPSPPSVFHAEVDGVVRPFVVVAAEAADIVVSIDPTTAEIDTIWD